MDHSHTNYFLPFDAASYFDAAAATYNPYTDFYSHQQSATSTSTTAAAAASYHPMYRTAPTTLRHPSSFYSATMQSKSRMICFFQRILTGGRMQVCSHRIKCLVHRRMIRIHHHFLEQHRRHQEHFYMIINENNDVFERHLQVYNYENWKNVFNK